MKLIPFDQIEVAANRQRLEFDPSALADLADSIEAGGLQHPVVVREAGGRTFLVAGERRLRAIRDLHDFGRGFRCGGAAVPEGLVPTLSLGELTPLEAEEAELEENIRRTDLTWQERAAATERVAALRARQAAASGRAPPSISDLTREVRPSIPPSAERGSGALQGQPVVTTRDELIVAPHLHDPAIAKAASLKEAVKIIKRREADRVLAAMASAVGPSFTAARHQLERVDCRAWMRAAAAEQFDVILTDPPYGIGADNFGDSGRQTERLADHAYDDSYEAWRELLIDLPELLFKVAKPDAHAYLFCDVVRFVELKELMTTAGWRVHRTPFIWHYPKGFRVPWPTQGPQRRYEAILYAVKGKLLTRKVLGDVLTCSRDENLGHPAQKPLALLADLLDRSAVPGMRVFDPFAGGGATISACHEKLLSCTALEAADWAYNLAVKRLQGLERTEVLR